MADSPPPTSASPGPTLRQRTAHGVLWGVLLAAVTRGVGFVQQLALAWLLQKSDFGLLGLALTVTAFINLMANPGIDVVLVQRQRRFNLWATPAFWMGMTTGTIGMLLTMAAAPLAAWIYDKPPLTGFLLVVATALPFQALQIVPKAKLQAELRFRTGMLVLFAGNVLTAVLTILCAILGFGAFSFAIPLPISAGVVAAIAWSQARPSVRWSPQVRRWKHLLRDSASLGVTKIIFQVVGIGDVIVLGLARMPDAAIGTYFFALNVALQPFRLISRSVETVLFPSLSNVSLDPAQQVRAMVRATRLLALVIVPVCSLQILLAGPMFRLFLPARWLDAMLPMQIIALTVMVSSPYWPSYSLMMAQRRFGEYLRLSIVYAATYFTTVALAVWLDRNIVTVAVAVALWNLLSSPYIFWTAVGRERSFFSYYVETYRPYFASLGAAVPCVLAMLLLPTGLLADALAIPAVAIVYCGLYLWLLRAVAPVDSQDMLVQLAPVLRKIGWRKLPGNVEAAKNESIP